MALRTLTSSRVDVWLTHSDLVRDPALLARYASLLSDEERARHARIVHEETRHQFLVTRALVRLTLSRYDAAVPPERWQFAANAYGRPELVDGQAARDLCFNVSHSRGLVACAVAVGRAVGIDVEWNGRNPSVLETVEQFFSPAEVQELEALPASRRMDRFFDVWTLKESYIKAHGRGLSMPLADFSFHLARADGRRSLCGLANDGIRLDPCPGDEVERWRFWLYHPTPEHTLGLTAECAAGTEVELCVEETIPLA